MKLYDFKKKKSIPSCAKIARELAYPLNMFYEVVSSMMLWACNYRIYSINRPGRLLNFWTLRVGAYYIFHNFKQV